MLLYSRVPTMDWQGACIPCSAYLLQIKIVRMSIRIDRANFSFLSVGYHFLNGMTAVVFYRDSCVHSLFVLLCVNVCGLRLCMVSTTIRRGLILCCVSL